MTPTDPTPDIATLLARALHENWHTHEFPEDKGVCDCPETGWTDRFSADILATPSGQAILDRLARAEAAVPDDPFMVDDNDALPNACYRCWGRWPKHDPDCKWLAARPAR
jgi:hypothetical protein